MSFFKTSTFCTLLIVQLTVNFMCITGYPQEYDEADEAAGDAAAGDAAAAGDTAYSADPDPAGAPPDDPYDYQYQDPPAPDQNYGGGSDPNDPAYPVADGGTENDGTPVQMPTFEIQNRTHVEKACTKLGKCWSSDLNIPVCGSDKIVYKNPGVLVCAQACNPGLEMENFCTIVKADVYTATDDKMCANCPKYEELTGGR